MIEFLHRFMRERAAIYQRDQVETIFGYFGLKSIDFPMPVEKIIKFIRGNKPNQMLDNFWRSGED